MKCSSCLFSRASFKNKTGICLDYLKSLKEKKEVVSCSEYKLRQKEGKNAENSLFEAGIF